MSVATAAIARSLAKHGVDATLVRPGDTYAGTPDITVAVRVLNRSYEGDLREGMTGAISSMQRWLIPASELEGEAITRPQPYDRLEFAWGTVTIRTADPGIAFGEIVRWDIQVAGQV